MKHLGLQCVAIAIALSVGLASSQGAFPAPTGVASQLTAKKCKKRHTAKARKKCFKQLAATQPAAPPAATVQQQASLALRCVDCAPFGANPIAHQDSSTITFAGSLSPAGSGTIQFGYQPGTSGHTEESIPVDSTGAFSKTFTLNNEDTYNNQVTARFAGDATRTSAFASLTFYVYD